MREGKGGRRPAAALIAAIIAASAIVDGSLVVAGSDITGGGQLNGSITFGEFPCDFPTSCTATISAGFRGLFAGVDDNGKAFTVSFPDVTSIPPLPSTNFTASFGYSDNCPFPTWTPSATIETGTGNGTFQISGGLLEQGAITSHSAVVKGLLQWSRRGSTALLGFTTTSVVNASGVVIASGTLGAGEVVMALPAAALTASCDATTFTVTGNIAGIALAFT
jgi:hypothetical protein